MGDDSPKTLAWYREQEIEPELGTPIKCEFHSCLVTWPYGTEGNTKKKRFCNRKCKDRYRPDRDNKVSDFAFVKFLTKGRTYREIAEKFNISKTQIKQLLKKDYPNFELYQTRNHFQEEIFVFLPEIIDEISVAEKIWTYKIQKDREPYIWIQFPELPYEKLILVPLADIHRGALAHDRERFEEYINWIAQNDNVFAFITGDLLELAYGDTLRGIAVFEQNARPQDQRVEMAKLLAPIAHKILWAIPGNHEYRSKKYDFNPLEWICDRLDIPYFGEPVYADVLWSGYVFDFFCQHGTTSSQTKGGKLNAASGPLKFQDFTMFTLYSHVHDGMVNKVQRICRDRVNFRLKIKKQYVVICPSFLKYFGTYAAIHGYAPGSLGAVACEIYANGDYHASS